MKFKKTFAVLAASLLLGGALAGCGGGEKKAAEADDNQLVIYCPHPLSAVPRTRDAATAAITFLNRMR